MNSEGIDYWPYCSSCQVVWLNCGIFNYVDPLQTSVEVTERRDAPSQEYLKQNQIMDVCIKGYGTSERKKIYAK